jgi:hypothetical protein
MKKKSRKEIQEPTINTPLSVLYEIQSIIKNRNEGSDSPVYLADRLERILDEVEHSLKKSLNNYESN